MTAGSRAVLLLVSLGATSAPTPQDAPAQTATREESVGYGVILRVPSHWERLPPSLLDTLNAKAGAVSSALGKKVQYAAGFALAGYSDETIEYPYALIQIEDVGARVSMNQLAEAMATSRGREILRSSSDRAKSIGIASAIDMHTPVLDEVQGIMWLKASTQRADGLRFESLSASFPYVRGLIMLHLYDSPSLDTNRGREALLDVAQSVGMTEAVSPPSALRVGGPDWIAVLDGVTKTAITGGALAALALTIRRLRRRGEGKTRPRRTTPGPSSTPEADRSNARERRRSGRLRSSGSDPGG